MGVAARWIASTSRAWRSRILVCSSMTLTVPRRFPLTLGSPLILLTSCAPLLHRTSSYRCLQHAHKVAVCSAPSNFLRSATAIAQMSRPICEVLGSTSNGHGSSLLGQTRNTRSSATEMGMRMDAPTCSKRKGHVGKYCEEGHVVIFTAPRASGRAFAAAAAVPVHPQRIISTISRFPTESDHEIVRGAPSGAAPVPAAGPATPTACGVHSPDASALEGVDLDDACRDLVPSPACCFTRVVVAEPLAPSYGILVAGGRPAVLARSLAATGQGGRCGHHSRACAGCSA